MSILPDLKDRFRRALAEGVDDADQLLDLIRRSAELFGRVTVALALHHSKRELLPLERRLELLREVLADIPGAEVACLEGLVVEGARALGCDVVVRGARGNADFEYEAQMARANRALAPELDTVILTAAPEHAHISSTLVRQVAEMGGPLESFVPPPVARALAERNTT